MRRSSNASEDKKSKFNNLLVKRNHARAKKTPRKKRECKAMIEKETEQMMFTTINARINQLELLRPAKFRM